MRVLIVEDYVDVAVGLEHIVQDGGHETRSAVTAEEALEIALAWPPDFVLLDIGLPNMNGYTLAWKLRQELGLSEVKIFVMSGDPADQAREKVARIDGHLMKPLDLKVVVDLLEQHRPALDRSPAGRPGRS